MKVVRRRATDWGIATDRIGMMGFSAGARVTTGVALEHDAESRPNLAAPIYGALWEEITVPANAPPLFLALANDDELVGWTQVWRCTAHGEQQATRSNCTSMLREVMALA
jgi:dienelactone hydrolase